MGRKREREGSPWKKGENECAMSALRNQDRMVPPSNATPSRGGPEGGGVPVQTESPDTSVSGGGRPDLVARKASPSTCPHRASPGAQASIRVPKATVYPGVRTLELFVLTILRDGWGTMMLGLARRRNIRISDQLMTMPTPLEC